MNIILPVTTPQFLSDTLFANYGFFTGTSTQFQRTAAYAIAENMVAREVGTFLYPTTFTGSFPWVSPDNIVVSPVGMIQSVQSVVLYERYSDGVDRLISGTSYMLDEYNGFFTIDASEDDVSTCAGCGYPEYVYKAEIAILAGYPTGVAAVKPDIQLAMCMAADIVLKFMYDEGALPSGDDFVRTYQVGRYIQTVTDKFAFETSFGVSNKAQFIRNLLKPYKIHRAGKLGR